MENFDSINHLDFPVPTEFDSGLEVIQFESLEAKRIEIIQALLECTGYLDAKYGRLHPDDSDGYVDRLLQLEAMMRDDMTSFGLSRGDVIQAKVPNIVIQLDCKLNLMLASRYEHK